ncbi:hypothetical protein RUM44_004703 [Polyplax serrata]|uniref:Uncharacterized protein n=1 Tax=Polyplax serrata TaxID=468196 RepID=A0ABR1B3L7_POLSC
MPGYVNRFRVVPGWCSDPIDIPACDYGLERPHELEELEAERQQWSGLTETLSNSRKSNPREAEEPPVQSEPVDLSRRSDQNHLDKSKQFSSMIEDTRNNNNDGNKYLSCDGENRVSNGAKVGSEDLRNYWKMVVSEDVSSNYGVSQDQKSPTTKNPVPKSPWRSNTQVGSIVKSKTKMDDVKKDETDDKFVKSSPLVLQVPKYNPQLLSHHNLTPTTVDTSQWRVSFVWPQGEPPNNVGTEQIVNSSLHSHDHVTVTPISCRETPSQ